IESNPRRATRAEHVQPIETGHEALDLAVETRERRERRGPGGRSPEQALAAGIDAEDPAATETRRQTRRRERARRRQELLGSVDGAAGMLDEAHALRDDAPAAVRLPRLHPDVGALRRRERARRAE